jgi:hypothetical protein
MSSTAVDNFRTLLSQNLSTLCDEESLVPLLNAVCDTYTQYTSSHSVKTRAPRTKKVVAPVVETAATTETVVAPAETASTRTRRPRRVVDPSEPQKPKKRNGYNMFVQHTMRNHPEISLPQTKDAEGVVVSGLSSKEKMSRCSVEWGKLSVEEKATWATRAQEFSQAAATEVVAETTA